MTDKIAEVYSPDPDRRHPLLSVAGRGDQQPQQQGSRLMTNPEVPWQTIVPLQAEEAPPEFPTDALPSWLARFVRAQATASAVPEDLPGILGLATLATATQGRLNVIANGGNWIEPICLYTAIAMNPGERKSAVFAFMTEPLQDWEAEIQQIEAPEIAASKMRTKELESAIENGQREIAKARAEINTLRRASADPATIISREGDLSVIRDSATEAQLEFDQHRERRPMRLLFDDITPEAVATALFEQIRSSVGILSAEGGIFDILGGRYSDKPALDIFLKGHSADSYRVDRKGRDSEIIRRPIINLGLAVQPAVFQAIGKSKDMHGRGLLARFLYSVPESAVGEREIRPANVPESIRADYAAKIREIAGSAYATDEIQTIYLDEEADEAFMAFQEALEPRLKPEIGELEGIVEWASKFAGAILRIAALIAVGRNESVQNLEITFDDMRQALQFAPYLEAHAWRAFGMMGLTTSDNTIEGRIVRRIVRTNMRRFSIRDLMRAVRVRDLTAREVEEILRGIEQHNHIVRERQITPGRSYWEANPALWEPES